MWKWGATREALLLVTALGVAALVFACTPAGKMQLWTEDVKFPDGRIVTLTRYQEFMRNHAIGEESGPSKHWFEFKHPQTGEMVRWEEPGELGTVALFLVAGLPHLLVRPYYVSSFNDLNCPSPAYLLFRYKDHKWERIDLTQLPDKRLRSNMTFSFNADDRVKMDQHNHISVEKTQAEMHDRTPWVMDFTDLKAQTFGPQNCNDVPDYWLVSERVPQEQ
jgi:hypothetical protein